MIDTSDNVGVLKAGDLSLIDITLHTGKTEIPLFHIFQCIEIYEDLYSPFLTGTISIIESFNLIDELPLIGEERLRVEFATPGLPSIKKEFYITGVNKHDLEKDNKHNYILEFVSKNAIIDLNTRISKTFSGTGKDIVLQIFKEYYKTSGDFLNTEPSFGRMKFNSPYWTPSQCISYVTSKATTGDAYAVPDFLFYETMTGHRFASLTTLMKTPPTRTLFFDKKPLRVSANGQKSVRDIEREYNTAKRMRFTSTFNYVERINSGMFNTHITEFNILKKSIKVRGASYIEDFDKITHLEKYPIQSKDVFKAPVIGKMKVTSPQGYDGYGDTTADTLAKRLSRMASLDAYKLDLHLPGRTDTTVGQVVNLNIPRYKTVNEDVPEDKNLNVHYSGKYLITAILHRMTKSLHEMHMQIIKDSSPEEIDLNKAKRI